VISEGSCDTEDWRNDAENSALRHRNKLQYKNILKQKTIILTIISNKCRFGEDMRLSKKQSF